MPNMTLDAQSSYCKFYLDYIIYNILHIVSVELLTTNCNGFTVGSGGAWEVHHPSQQTP